MSIKHRIKDRKDNGKMRPLFRVGPEHFSGDYVKWGYVDYGRNPSWYNREFNNRPKRKEANQLCRQIVTGDREADAVLFPDAIKPTAYYW